MLVAKTFSLYPKLNEETQEIPRRNETSGDSNHDDSKEFERRVFAFKS